MKKPNVGALHEMDKERTAARKLKLCAICSLPPELLAVVNQGWREGVTGKTIHAYVEQQGHQISIHTIKSHFIAGRHAGDRS